MDYRHAGRLFLSRMESASRASRRPRSRNHRPAVEALEGRVVPAGTWTNLAASGSGPSSGGGAMMLLSDGSILIQNGSNPPPSASFFKLTPQANTGSYVNGSWSGGGTMNEARLFFSTAMLPNVNVFAVGGEYTKLSNSDEV